MTYFVYIIYSPARDKFYVGQTDNLQKRQDDHNQGMSPYTKGGEPWILKYHESFDTRTKATSRERQIKKKKSRKYIEWLTQTK